MHDTQAVIFYHLHTIWQAVYGVTDGHVQKRIPKLLIIQCVKQHTYGR